MSHPERDATQQRLLSELSIRELNDLATPEAWKASWEHAQTPYIFAGKAGSPADTLTRPAIMTGLWPIHERAQTEAAERTTFANTHFVCALVNAYRNGELVERSAPSAIAASTGETPRTDAEASIHDEASEGGTSGYINLLAHARQLERESDEWRQAYYAVVKGRTAPSATGSAMPTAVKLALMTLLNHVEPGWDNCKAVLQAWLAENSSSTTVRSQE